jgi:hypothetical protein
MNNYNLNLRNHQYNKAIKNIENNKLLHQNRNKLIYNFELGRLHYLNNNPKESNKYFNLADDQLEANYKTVKDVVLSNLLNPMMEIYRGEEFEKFMLNYYKSMNYISLGQPDEAVVEARKITLASDRLSEKNRNTNKYNKDAFAFNLQGMIYEMSGDMNNAFISYRDAANTYIDAGGVYYGTSIPDQLKIDLLNSASAMGFTDEQEKYEKLFNQKLSNNKSNFGELILFFEEGNAPLKTETSFTIVNTGNGNAFQYVDQYGSYVSFPFVYSSYGINNSQQSDIKTFRVAMPQYSIVTKSQISKSVNVNGESQVPLLAQDFNTLAISVLNERFLTELAKTAARYIVKRATEKGSGKLAENLANSNSKSNETDEEKKKREDRAEAVGNVVSFLVNITNSVTEKADTRCWISLPAYISYMRIPLKEGENTIDINANGKKQTLKINSQKGIQMKSVLLD